MKRTYLFSSITILLGLFLLRLDASEGMEPTKEEEVAIPPQKLLVPKIITTDHVLFKDGVSYPYEAKVGFLQIKGPDEKTKANVFFTAYFLKTSEDKPRPITFCFNGGPGSSSMWLHLGGIGPKRVDIKDLEYNSPPGQYVDNPETLLLSSDLVFVDPVSTGFSHTINPDAARMFHGVHEDAIALSGFIQKFISKFQRWNCPKYLLGESYGTLRAVMLSSALDGLYSISLNGLILISTALQYEPIMYDSDLSYALALPSYAATAWFHKKVPNSGRMSFDDFLSEVEEFAQNGYLSALSQGSNLTQEKKKEVATVLSSYIGLPVAYLMKSDLKVPLHRFTKELLRDESKVLGNYDTRFTAYDSDPIGEAASVDPSERYLSGAFNSALQSYLFKDLGWKKTQPYFTFNDQVWPWNWSMYHRGVTSYPDVLGNLEQTLLDHPKMRVFVACGQYDLVTPYYAQEYTFARLSPKIRENIQITQYGAGHMMYIRKDVREALLEDLSAFIEPDEVTCDERGNCRSGAQ
jgi:carboxypeptidase C (cathepsin A)